MFVTFFTSIDCVQFQRIFSSQISNNNHLGPTIIGNENGTHEYDVEFFLEKKGPRLPTFNQMEKLYSFYLEACFNYKKHRCIGRIWNQFELKKG